MISENGSIGFQSNPEEAYIPKLIHKCAKLPQSNRQMLPGWRQSRPLVRPYNGLKSSKYIRNMYTFYKLKRGTYSLRPRRPQSGPKVPRCTPQSGPKVPKYMPSSTSMPHIFGGRRCIAGRRLRLIYPPAPSKGANRL